MVTTGQHQASISLLAYVKIVGRGEHQIVAQLIWCASTQAIEYVVVAFLLALRANTRLLEKIVGNEATGHFVLLAEVQLDKLAKATAIVVTRSLGIAERFEQWVCLKVKVQGKRRRLTEPMRRKTDSNYIH